MMSLFLGEEVFRQGISAYLKKHEFKNAEQDDLWDSLTEEAHKYAMSIFLYPYEKMHTA